MKRQLNILLIIFLTFFFVHRKTAQDSYRLTYNFRLYNQKGDLLNCDSLITDKIEIFMIDGGEREKPTYSDSSCYFTISVSRVFPASNFHLLWTHLDKRMDINIELNIFCGQGGHSPNFFWLDKIIFEIGKYTADENSGLKINCVGNEVHASMSIIDKLHRNNDTPDNYYINYSDRIIKINCH